MPEVSRSLYVVDYGLLMTVMQCLPAVSYRRLTFPHPARHWNCKAKLLLQLWSSANFTDPGSSMKEPVLSDGRENAERKANDDSVELFPLPPPPAEESLRNVCSLVCLCILPVDAKTIEYPAEDNEPPPAPMAVLPVMILWNSIPPTDPPSHWCRRHGYCLRWQSPRRC